MDSSSRRGIHNRINPLPRCTATISRPLPLHFCRLRNGRVLHVGNCRNRWIDFAIPDSRQIVRTGRALFVRPLPHTPAVCHLAGAPNSRSADLDVLVDLHPGVRCPQCLGYVPRKGNEYAGEQTHIAEKTRPRLDSFLSPRSEPLAARMNPSLRAQLKTKTKRIAQDDSDLAWLEFQVWRRRTHRGTCGGFTLY